MITILVIDDDPLIADIIQALDPVWQVVSALDGLSGLDILRHSVAQHHPPDLVILDIHMPEFDGYDTCRSRTPFRMASTPPGCSGNGRHCWQAGLSWLITH